MVCSTSSFHRVAQVSAQHAHRFFDERIGINAAWPVQDEIVDQGIHRVHEHVGSHVRVPHVNLRMRLEQDTDLHAKLVFSLPELAPKRRWQGGFFQQDTMKLGLVALVQTRGWKELGPYEAIGAIYDFVRNEIRFGYNGSDDLPASAVLADGYGQCNTKGTLLMTLLRSVGIQCRLHGFTIDKELQRGAITAIAYQLAPRSIIHSWVEVLHDGNWINLEGFILDASYLDGVRCLFPDAKGAFCAYAIGTPNIQNPAVEWKGSDTYIQNTGISDDFGVFDSPDAFYAKHGANLCGLRRILYERVFRHLMNANVARVRRQSRNRAPSSS